MTESFDQSQVPHDDPLPRLAGALRNVEARRAEMIKLLPSSREGRIKALTSSLRAINGASERAAFSAFGLFVGGAVTFASPIALAMSPTASVFPCVAAFGLCLGSLARVQAHLDRAGETQEPRRLRDRTIAERDTLVVEWDAVVSRLDEFTNFMAKAVASPVPQDDYSKALRDTILQTRGHYVTAITHAMELVKEVNEHESSDVLDDHFVAVPAPASFSFSNTIAASEPEPDRADSDDRLDQLITYVEDSNLPTQDLDRLYSWARGFAATAQIIRQRDAVDEATKDVLRARPLESGDITSPQRRLEASSGFYFQN